MPTRITVDENGFVVSVEPAPPLKTQTIPVRKKRKAKKLKRRSTLTRRSSQSTLFRSDGRVWISCSICGDSVLEKDLQKHRKKVHLVDGEPQPSTAKPARVTGPPKKGKKSRSRTTCLLSPSSGGKRDRTGKNLGLQGEALRQSFEDSSYGGKGLGHVRREQGRFGSLPLYDDYGDESGAY